MKFLTPIAVMVMVLLISCERTTTVLDDGSALVKEGYIRGVVTTVRANGTPLNFEFNHEYRTAPTGMAEYMVVGRLASFEALLAGTGYSTVWFHLDSLQDSMPEFTSFEMAQEIDLGNDSTFMFWANTWDMTELTIGKFEFDEVASNVSGNFTVHTENLIIGEDATIEGAFSVKVSHYVEKQSSVQKRATHE